MRLLAAGLAILLPLSACASTGDSGRAPAADVDNVLVDLDGDPADLALRVLLAADGLAVSAVSLPATDGQDCEDAATGVLADTSHEEVPIVCGPDQLAGLDGEVLDAVDTTLVLGPLTTVAAVLGRLPETPIIVAAGPTTGGAPANFAADPGAARKVIEGRTLTVVPDSVGADPTAEEVAAWLVVDETLGSFALEDIEVTDAGELVAADGGATVRQVEEVDTQRIAALAASAGPAPGPALAVPELRWRVEIGSVPRGTHRRPAIAGEVVIVGGVDGQVHGVSLATGEVAWTVETGTEGVAAAGVAYLDGVAVVSAGLDAQNPMGSYLVAIDVDDKSVLWTFDPHTVSPDSLYLSSPAIAGGLVYAGTGIGPPRTPTETGVIVALDLRTGDLAWERAGFGGLSEPRVAGDDLVVGGTDGTLRVLDRYTGELRWERDLVNATNGIASRPLVAGGIVYVTGDDGSVHALDLESGETVWRVHTSAQPITASPVLVDGRLIVAQLFGAQLVRALDPATGNELWATLVGDVLGDPVVAGDTVVVATFSGPGSVIGLDHATGQKRWEFDNPEEIDGSPIVVDDVLIYQSSDVYALELP